ncbi:MAG: ArsR/SmtB family transcription factor [Clostridiaceae bacterium]
MNKLTDFFKTISDETRLRIIILLYHKKLCVCELCGIMEESQPKISKHLAKLRDLGYVKDERQEQYIYYSLNLERFPMISVIEEIVRNQEAYPEIKKDILTCKKAESFLKICKKQ